MEPDRRLSWQGREIAWTRAGSGPPVVFCHGTPWSSALWAPFAAELCGAFTVHLWDMPGYGHSSKAPGHPVDFGAQAETLAALVEAWGLDRPHLVAHDFGGAVSLLAHLRHGVPYASLLLVDVVAIPPSGSPFFRFVQAHPDVLPQLPDPIHEAVVRAYVGGASRRGLRDDDLEVLAAPWRGEEGKAAFSRQIAQYDEHHLVDLEERLPGLDLPVRILWGRDDSWIPTATAERLAALTPGATLRLIDDAGHLVHLDAPVALATELRAWLAAQA